MEEIFEFIRILSKYAMFMYAIYNYM